MSPTLFVFTALACEAKPLIQAWQLKKLTQYHPYAIYADANRVLVVSGPGQIAMAGAIGYVMGLFPNPHYPVLINLGIAGHSCKPLGTLLLADKIINLSNAKNYYPQLPMLINCETATVWTHTHAQMNYAEPCLYDMEAAGFYELAVKFSCSELIQCLKVVSDNRDTPLEHITEAAVTSWLNTQLGPIEELIEQCLAIRQQLPALENKLFEQLITQFHFTASSAIRLKNGLIKWQLLKPEEQPAWETAELKNGKDFLNWLEAELDKIEFYL
jgi:hypothetical protein